MAVAYLGKIADTADWWATNSDDTTYDEDSGYVTHVPVDESVPAGTTVAFVLHNSVESDMGPYPGRIADDNGNVWQGDELESLIRSQIVVDSEHIGVYGCELVAPLGDTVHVHWPGYGPTLSEAWMFAYTGVRGRRANVGTTMTERHLDLALDQGTPDVTWSPPGNLAVGVALDRQQIVPFAGWRDPAWETLIDRPHDESAFNSGRITIGHRLGTADSPEHFGAFWSAPLRARAWRGATATELALDGVPPPGAVAIGPFITGRRPKRRRVIGS